MNNLRVAQVSTSASGGAALAAMRLNEILISRNICSTFIQSPDKSIVSKDRFISRVSTALQKSITRDIYGIATPFSFSKVDRDKLIRNFDLLHIHNWYNLLTLEDFDYLGNRMPILFSMHDERLLTGGCHTTLGCKQFLQDCKGCPAVKIGSTFIRTAKHSISSLLNSLPKFAVVTPSIWMREQWRLAHPDYARVCEHIPNIIYPPGRVKMGFKSNEIFQILFISANLTTPVKGLLNLLGALAKSDLVSKVRLHLIGGGTLPRLPNSLKFINHGTLSTDEIYGVMQRCDLLVVPSFSENSPNVIAEAQLLGLPVLASNVGGNLELIEHAVTGFLANPDKDSLELEIRSIIDNSDLLNISHRANIFATHYWDNERNASSFIELYRRVLN